LTRAQVRVNIIVVKHIPRYAYISEPSWTGKRIIRLRECVPEDEYCVYVNQVTEAFIGEVSGKFVNMGYV
jgi:hypothetical protein